MQSPQFQLHAAIEERHWWFMARRQIVRKLIEKVLPPSRDKLMVDVGCGTGANLGGLAGDYDCLGIDTSAEAVALAQQRFPSVRFQTGYAPEDIADDMPRADLVMLMDVLEHVPDDFSLLTRLLSASSPGTLFLITVPADQSLWSQHDESFGHYRRYDRARLQRVWQGLPVTELLCSHYNSRLYPLIKGVRMFNRWRNAAAGESGTDFHLPNRFVNNLLRQTFASEAGRLIAGLQQQDESTCSQRAAPFRQGVSLVAILRREAGWIEPSERPTDVAADYFNPAAIPQPVLAS